MVTSEREMIRPLLEEQHPAEQKPEERFTSLQPTYEDSVPPDPDDWEYNDAG
jgi:hypothetical protein